MLRCLVAAKLTAPFAASYRQQFDDPWTVCTLKLTYCAVKKFADRHGLQTILGLNLNKVDRFLCAVSDGQDVQSTTLYEDNQLQNCPTVRLQTDRTVYKTV